MPIVYLCGGINGLSDIDCMDWRQFATRQLENTWTILDPMRRDFRGKEFGSVKDIINFDLQDIVAADVLLVNATRASWGTAMEIVYGHLLHKRIVAFVAPQMPISPWLRGHCAYVAPTIDEALRRLHPPT